jgi:hypothetical protein
MCTTDLLISVHNMNQLYSRYELRYREEKYGNYDEKQ